MSDYEHESGFDGDSEGRGEVTWSEKEWRQFLNRYEAEVDRFCAYIEKIGDAEYRLDKVAQLMGWEGDNWLDLDDCPVDLIDYGFDAGFYLREEEDVDDDSDPYTIHRHPLFVVTRGLYNSLITKWEQRMEQCERSISRKTVWDFTRQLRDGECNAILAIQALDMGDYALAICHFKSALSAVNHSLDTLQRLPANRHRNSNDRVDECARYLFDLREVWLKTMQACREEAQRRYPESD